MCKYGPVQAGDKSGSRAGWGWLGSVGVGRGLSGLGTSKIMNWKVPQGTLACLYYGKLCCAKKNLALYEKQVYVMEN